MPFPKTFDEMKAQGYKFDNYAECRGCGDAIEWWITPSGKKIPMNPRTSGSSEAVSHFATCSEEPTFRKNCIKESEAHMADIKDDIAEVLGYPHSHVEKEILEAVRGLKRDVAYFRQDIDHRLRWIEKLLRPKTLTASIAISFSGASAMNSIVFNVGQTSQASLVTFLTDGVTPSGGTLSNVSYAFTDPSATVVLNSDGLTATCTGVAPSTGAVTGTASCTVTDTDGAVSQWNQAFTITTNTPPPPSQLTQSVGVSFTAPTP